jgi:hypothetical protein
MKPSRWSMQLLTTVLLAGFVGMFPAAASAAGPIHIKLEPAGSSVVMGACSFGVEFTELIRSRQSPRVRGQSR